MSNMHKKQIAGKGDFPQKLSIQYVIDFYCLFAFWPSVILGQFPHVVEEARTQRWNRSIMQQIHNFYWFNHTWMSSWCFSVSVYPNAIRFFFAGCVCQHAWILCPTYSFMAAIKPLARNNELQETQIGFDQAVNPNKHSLGALLLMKIMLKLIQFKTPQSGL